MRRSERGSVLVWMMVVTLFGLITVAFGAARFGVNAGDYVHRQITADAVVRSAGDVLADRLRHVGRIQKEAEDLWRNGKKDLASRYARLARMIAEATPDVVRKEAQAVATKNGASIKELRGIPSSGAFPNGWFVEEVETSALRKEIRWLRLAPNFERQKVEARIGQKDADGRERAASAAVRVERLSGDLNGRITTNDWVSRLATP